jgi:hypothetical protein
LGKHINGGERRGNIFAEFAEFADERCAAGDVAILMFANVGDFVGEEYCIARGWKTL